MDIDPENLPRCENLDASTLRLVSYSPSSVTVDDPEGRRAVYIPEHHVTFHGEVSIVPAYTEAGFFQDANRITVQDSTGLRVVCIPAAASVGENLAASSKWREHTVRLHDGAVVAPAEINGLPEKLRRYIYELETRADPAGDIKQIASLTEQRDALVLKVKELEAELGKASTDPHDLADCA